MNNNNNNIIMRMKCKYLFYAIMAITATGIAACSDDDEPVIENEEFEPEVVDQVAVLKQSLLTEENGKEVLLRGEALDAADPTVVSISVDDSEDAYERFTALFSDETETSADGMTYTLTDTLSQNAGTAKFVKSNDGNGLVAYAEFAVPAIPQLSRINYILHSAWPDNAKVKGFHKLGERYEYKGWSGRPTADSKFDANEVFKYVCVREYNGGEPALLVAISPNTHYINFVYSLPYSNRIVGKHKAQSISYILRYNWKASTALFNKDGNILNKDEYYWINDGHEHGISAYRYAIRLSDGKLKDWETLWHRPKKRVIFFIESREKM